MENEVLAHKDINSRRGNLPYESVGEAVVSRAAVGIWVASSDRLVRQISTARVDVFVRQHFVLPSVLSAE